eukprot:5784303-Prymnesium_polylepis.1
MGSTVFVVVSMVRVRLFGDDTLFDASTASLIGLPRAAPGGNPWWFGRAGLPHSLMSELATDTER